MIEVTSFFFPQAWNFYIFTCSTPLHIFLIAFKEPKTHSTPLIFIDSAALIQLGHRDTRWGETDVSGQNPATSTAKYFTWRTVKDRRTENKTVGFSVKAMVWGKDGSKGECWQASRLVKEEDPGRYGCRPKSICTSRCLRRWNLADRRTCSSIFFFSE